MQLKRQISAQTTLDADMIKLKIITELKEADYKIEQIIGTTIPFNNRGWEIKLNGTQASKVDEGMFEIAALENNKNITLTYCLSLNYVLAQLAIVVIISFWFGFVVLFLAGGLIVFTLIRLLVTKIGCEEMLKRIVGDS